MKVAGSMTQMPYTSANCRRARRSFSTPFWAQATADVGGVVGQRRQGGRRVLRLHGEDDDVAGAERDGVDAVGDRHRQHHRPVRVVDGEPLVADGVVVGAPGHEGDVVPVAVGVLEQAAADHAADGAGPEDDDPHDPAEGAIDRPNADSKRR